MKRVKKLLSLVLAMMLVLAMGSTVMAGAPTTPGADTTHTITIKNAYEGHVYGAYQVFSGTFFEGKLSNIKWGASVGDAGGSTLLGYLQGDDTFVKDGANVFADCATAEGVADVLATFGDNSDLLNAFAAHVEKVLSENPVGKSNGSTEKDGKFVYEIPVVGDGYYLIKDENGSMLDDEESSFTKLILEVVDDVTAETKVEALSVSKKIVDKDGNETTLNSVSVGDVIDFKVESKVPAMYNYDTYPLIVRDTPSEGLTFNKDVKVTIGGKEITSGYKIYLTPAEGNRGTEEITADTDMAGKSFQIEFDDLKALQAAEGFATDDLIEITYSATVNDAAVTSGANTNSVKLIYPKPVDPENPDEKDPFGETPESKTESYITKIQLIKKADSEDGEALSGAEFKLTGTSMHRVKATGIRFVPNEAGAYWKLKDNTYTDTDPETEGINKDNYVTPYERYDRVEYEEYVDTTEQKEITAWVDETNGELIFEGLGEGKYEITEITAPNGYNKLETPIKIWITLEKPTEAGKEAIWKAYEYTEEDADGNPIIAEGSKDLFNNEKSMVVYTVVNKSGATLPSTGGIGTTIFYVLGGILVVGAGIMLVVKKRMSSEK